MARLDGGLWSGPIKWCDFWVPHIGIGLGRANVDQLDCGPFIAQPTTELGHRLPAEVSPRGRSKIVMLLLQYCQPPLLARKPPVPSKFEQPPGRLPGGNPGRRLPLCKSSFNAIL